MQGGNSFLRNWCAFFNLLKVTSDAAADCLGPRTKRKGKLLAEKLGNNDNVIDLE